MELMAYGILLSGLSYSLPRFHIFRVLFHFLPFASAPHLPLTSATFYSYDMANNLLVSCNFIGVYKWVRYLVHTVYSIITFSRVVFVGLHVLYTNNWRFTEVSIARKKVLRFNHKYFYRNAKEIHVSR